MKADVPSSRKPGGVITMQQRSEYDFANATCACTETFCGHGKQKCGKPLDEGEKLRMKHLNDPNGRCNDCSKALNKHVDLNDGIDRRPTGKLPPRDR